MGSYAVGYDDGPSQDSQTVIDPNGPFQDHTSTNPDPPLSRTVASQGSISAVCNVCNHNCPFQDTVNIVHANQSSPNIQTLTPQRHTIVSESAAVDTLIGPYQDQQTVISSLCYPNCPF